MDNETAATAPSFHTLIPLADFKAILGADNRALYVEEAITGAVKRLLSGQVNEILGEGDLYIPPDTRNWAFPIQRKQSGKQYHFCKKKRLLKEIAFAG